MGSSKTKRCITPNHGRRIQTIQKKKKKLRNNEYYNMQEVYDRLYAESKNGNNFYKLYEIITSKQNIRLAYRNLKTNDGSTTAGVDGRTIEDVRKCSEQFVIQKVQNKLSNYQPQPVKRVYIPKPGSDKTRPLGIPTIWDRLVQQCILQVLEPVCEPKFYNHSYGFRQNRSCEHAISRVASLINIARYHYCVDIDIKGFFDNVNHGKLLKQMWTLGIRDKRVLSIISKMLKAEIHGEGIPTRGTPQGGIISPLLSLIVLNELDWWISSQWENFKTSGNFKGKGFGKYAEKYTNLKKGYIVRYCDDFKIMCRTYEETKRYYYATIDFLDKRLGLEINHEKSKVVNLKKNASDFLGFKIKVIPKGNTRNGFVAKTDMNKKAISKAKKTMKNRLHDIVKKDRYRYIDLYNSTVVGIQNYYHVATNIYNNLTEVKYAMLPSLRIRLRAIAKVKKFSEMDERFKSKTYGIQPNTKIYTIGNKGLLPISGVKRYNPLNFSQEVCDYTKIGRKRIHDELLVVTPKELGELQYIRDPIETIEFNDNIVSSYIVQKGNCYISKKKLIPNQCVAIRKEPSKERKQDEYTNIVIVYQHYANFIFHQNSNVNTVIETINLELEMKRRLLKLYNNYSK